MPKQTLASHYKLYDKLTQAATLHSNAVYYTTNYSSYKNLNVEHIKLLIKEIIKLALNAFSPLACTNISEKNQIISYMKDAAFSNKEVELEKREDFPNEIVTLYFMRRTSAHNVKKINDIFNKHGLSCDRPEEYLPLIQSELIPAISNHIIEIMQIGSSQKTFTNHLISQYPIRHPIPIIAEESEEELEEENVPHVTERQDHYAF